MSETPSKSFTGRTANLLAAVIVSARWLMAPFYLGLAATLAALLYVFGRELVEGFGHLAGMNAEQAILFGLTMIDLSLAGNLILIVIFSGYANFVSPLDQRLEEGHLSWMGEVNFAALKIKLIASIIAISAVSLLKVFMEMTEHPTPPANLVWLLGLHGAFVATGVFLAVMDWLKGRND